MQTGAEFDATGCYRYLLWRSWDEQAPRVGFVMLNPSQADATVNDPTIRRCLGFARSWGYGSLDVVNLFAYRTAQPSELRRVNDPIGVENDRYLAALEQRVDHIILAWGNSGVLQSRDRSVMPLLKGQKAVSCFGLTKLGQPRHPLYVRREVPLSPWSPRCS
ncbi:DUF1643 domain-containing protein [Stenomitos frigidus]|uniref:DUF1643 domain-containing protein n=1 Tax=Stenomitos frigidus ULC18 TaxID=2107698 RepID=A0A2T1E6S6_9CYAN|nr:DUF1643 domain-containing protein [Stenomitos frigidus]PSB28436.1 hypothetical protein C7B82_13230 [Stenomitos frigidus ULC18]